MNPTTVDLAITLALQLATKASELFGRIGAAQAGGPPITDADLDAAATAVGVSRQGLLDAIKQAKAEGR